ncbi:MAG: hypothetical protein WC055_01060 [Melioribacteraceae bacterium]
MKITRKKADAINIQSLIDEAEVLDSTIKEAEKKLKPLKEQINKYIETGHSVTELQAGATETIPGLNSYLKFVSCESREDADPEKVFKEMDKIGKADRFFDTVKVSVKDAAEILGAELVKTLRPLKAKPYSIRLSFSKKG